MPLKSSPLIGKTLYGFLFIIALPAILLAWAKKTDAAVRLPVPEVWSLGVALMFCGAALMVLGIVSLMVYGKGLPMNPYPPLRYVTRGIYQLVSHPIYAGFSILWIGFALLAKSPAGLWLVSPVVILSCVALVLGFERPQLEKRFGPALIKPLIHLPENESTFPTFSDRLSVYVLVVFPWLILYEAVRWIGAAPDAVAPLLPFEKNLSVYEWTEIFYASTYIFVLLTPLIAGTRRDLREASISGLIGTGFIILLFLTIPFVAPPRPFVPHGSLGRLLAWERAVDTPAAAFPSFHVFWALLAAKVYAARMPRAKIVWWGWAGLISVSCITTGMHAVVDVLAGFVVFLLVTRRYWLWEQARRQTERIANSWREWRFGAVRIINHGRYAGMAAFVGLSIVGTLIGPGQLGSMMVIAISIVIAAAVWAQLVEGSSSLLRPFGWYGGVIGAIIGALIAGAFGAKGWLLLSAFCVAAPWIQSVGRLRCLVQGCCHGREASANVGISYTHPRSRVCRLTSLGHIPVHPTPLYSILCNVVIAIIVLRLWQLHAALSLIVGVYLIVTGLGRFVEESYRGEPQTAVKAGLRLYQWLAIASVLAGVLVTMVGSTPNAPAYQLSWESIVAAAGFGLFAWFALGVDFPDSNRRFARLA